MPRKRRTGSKKCEIIPHMKFIHSIDTYTGNASVVPSFVVLSLQIVRKNLVSMILSCRCAITVYKN